MGWCGGAWRVQDCMRGLGYAFSAEEVLAMADAADTDGDGTIDIHEFSSFIDARFKGEFRTYREPPQVPAPGSSSGFRPMIYRMLNPKGEFSDEVCPVLPYCRAGQQSY